MDVGALSGAAQQQAATSRTDLTGSFDMFLRLLTTQLQNQDPLQPTDSSEFTKQLVMYSQVEQQIKSNDQLANLVKLQGNLQLQSALTYIGMDVRVADTRFMYKGSGDYSFDYALPKDAKLTKIDILNENGDVVRSVAGETVGGKLHTYKWDGKTTDGDTAPAGKYTIRVAAQDADGKALTADVAVWNTVEGMETQADGSILLDLSGDIGVRLEDILGAHQHQQQTI